MAGATDAAPVLTGARALTEIKNKGDRTHYLRGHYDAAAGTFAAAGSQESHAIATLSNANAFARLEPSSIVSEGGAVRILRLD
jgi:molybdopterin biosynthesis enzyme